MEYGSIHNVVSVKIKRNLDESLGRDVHTIQLIIHTDNLLTGNKHRYQLTIFSDKRVEIEIKE